MFLLDLPLTIPTCPRRHDNLLPVLTLRIPGHGGCMYAARMTLISLTRSVWRYRLTHHIIIMHGAWFEMTSHNSNSQEPNSHVVRICHTCIWIYMWVLSKYWNLNQLMSEVYSVSGSQYFCTLVNGLRTIYHCSYLCKNWCEAKETYTVQSLDFWLHLGPLFQQYRNLVNFFICSPIISRPWSYKYKGIAVYMYMHYKGWKMPRSQQKSFCVGFSAPPTFQCLSKCLLVWERVWHDKNVPVDWSLHIFVFVDIKPKSIPSSRYVFFSRKFRST